ncbi:MAG: hypothetical protein WKF31_04715, partial [Thermoleophilaceae bacterium]
MVGDLVLDVGRGHVLAARGDDDVLGTARDGEEPVVVQRADVAGREPAVLVQVLVGRLLHLEVALEHVGAAHEDLAARVRRALVVASVLVLRAVPHPDLASLHRLALGAELEVVGAVEGRKRRGLAQAPALEHEHAAGVEELEHLLGHRSGSGHRQ